MASRVKKRPSAATKAMLLENNIALWDAYHYTTAASAHPGRPTAKDPVRVVRVSPLRLDRMFSGVGEDADAAVKHAFESNPDLRSLLSGLTGALGRLEMALAALDRTFYEQRCKILWERDGEVPF